MNRIILTILMSAALSFHSLADSPGKFVIKGNIDPEMKAKAVFITEKDDDGLDKTPRYVEIKNDKFTYETELDDIRPGSIQVLLPDGEMAKSMVNLDFVPDFTLYISIYDGYYRLTNGKDYVDYTEDFCKTHHKDPASGKPYTPLIIKKDSSLTDKEHLGSRKTYSSSDDEISRMSEILKSNVPIYVKEQYVNAEVQKNILTTKLNKYKELLNILETRIKTARTDSEYNAYIKQQTEVLKKMQSEIEKYSIADVE